MTRCRWMCVPRNRNPRRARYFLVWTLIVCAIPPGLSPARTTVCPPSVDAAVWPIYMEAYAGFLEPALDRMATLANRYPDCLMIQVYWSDLLQWQLLNRWIHAARREAVERQFMAATERILRRARRRKIPLVRDPMEAFAYAAAHLLRAQWYGFQGRWWKVVRPLRMGRHWLERAYALAPDSPEIQYYLGVYDYVMDRGSWVYGALRWLLAIPKGDRRRAWQFLNSAVARPSVWQTEIRMVITGLLQYEGRWLDALERLMRLRRTYPWNPFFHFWEGLFYERIAVDYPRALAVYREIWMRAQAGTDPRYDMRVAYQARYRMGYVLYRMFRFHAALQHFRAVLAMGLDDPPWVRPWTELARGQLYLDWGDIAAARAAFRRVLAMAPVVDSHERARRLLAQIETLRTRRAWVRYVRGRVWLAEGNIPRGCKHFQNWVKQAETHPVAWLGMGECYLMQDRFQEAVQAFQRAIAAVRARGSAWAQARAAVYLGQLLETVSRARAQQLYAQAQAYPQTPPEIRQAAAFRMEQLKRRSGRAVSSRSGYR